MHSYYILLFRTAFCNVYYPLVHPISIMTNTSNLRDKLSPTQSIFVLDGNLYADIHEIYIAFTSKAKSEPDCYDALVNNGKLIQKYPTHTETTNIIESLYAHPKSGVKTLEELGISPVLQLEITEDCSKAKKYLTAIP